MSVRNIDKGYIHTESGDIDIDTSQYVTIPLTFVGVTTTVNAVFNKHDDIVTLTLPPVYGPAAVGVIGIQCLLPVQYSWKSGVQTSQFAYVTSYDSTGSILGAFPGVIDILGITLEILTTGRFGSGPPQGLPNYTTIVYSTNLE